MGFGFLNMSLIDVIDIFVVALLMFQIYRLTRGTNALRIVAGILIVYLLWIVVRALKMELLSMILGQVIGVGVIALIIVPAGDSAFFVVARHAVHNRRHSFMSRIFRPRARRERRGAGVDRNGRRGQRRYGPYSRRADRHCACRQSTSYHREARRSMR
ncbi:MAG: hypothetical protein ACLR76_00915 [Alistipes sp.]